jgi:hypothetical protein
MRLWTVTAAMLISCGGSTASQPDASGRDPNDISECSPVGGVASCQGTTATTTIYFAGGSTSLTLCHAAPADADATCASCAVTATSNSQDVAAVGAHPELLCAETAEAKLGDVCFTPYFPQNSSSAAPALDTAIPCLPTRAKLAADGTVSGQDYLACDQAAGRCVAAPAPTVAAYLQACDAAIVAQYGTTGAVGVVERTDGACLIAWDATANAAKSGQTVECIGDWECPAGALCDDQMTVLSETAPTHPIAVCKPGPRGTLTPAML